MANLKKVNCFSGHESSEEEKSGTTEKVKKFQKRPSNNVESTVENGKIGLSDVIFCPFCDHTCIKNKPTNLDPHIARYN